MGGGGLVLYKLYQRRKGWRRGLLLLHIQITNLQSCFFSGVRMCYSFCRSFVRLVLYLVLPACLPVCGCVDAPTPDPARPPAAGAGRSAAPPPARWCRSGSTQGPAR